MRTSDRRPTAARARGRTVVLESLVASGLMAGLALALSPGDLGLGGRGPHLVWVAVAVLSARYGTRGLLTSLATSWGLVIALAALSGKLGLLAIRADGASDLGALGSVVLVAWVATGHERRQLADAVKLEQARAHGVAQQALVGELRDAVVVLRARAERLEVSLTFLGEVAGRMEGGDPVAAAEAALDLALARIGARAGVVELQAVGGPKVIAQAGCWTTTDGPGAPDLSGDHAVTAALRTGRPVRAIDLGDVAPSDSDLAVPLLDGAGVPFGVVAVRGVPHAGASLATLHDLAAVTAWLGRALGRALSLDHPASGVTDRQERLQRMADGDAGRAAGSGLISVPRFGGLHALTEPTAAAAAGAGGGDVESAANRS
jgi:hypothetical protein